MYTYRAKFSRNLLGEVVNTTIYLINICLTTRIDFKIMCKFRLENMLITQIWRFLELRHLRISLRAIFRELLSPPNIGIFRLTWVQNLVCLNIYFHSLVFWSVLEECYWSVLEYVTVAFVFCTHNQGWTCFRLAVAIATPAQPYFIFIFHI